MKRGEERRKPYMKTTVDYTQTHRLGHNLKVTYCRHTTQSIRDTTMTRPKINRAADVALNPPVSVRQPAASRSRVGLAIVYITGPAATDGDAPSPWDLQVFLFDSCSLGVGNQLW